MYDPDTMVMYTYLDGRYAGTITVLYNADGTLKMYMLMREQGFNAELRVRNGGHAQRYWRDSLPLTLTFVSIGFTEH